MSTPYIGEIRIVGFNYPPPGWAVCDGSLLSIADNTALFNLLGTNFGGDGQNTFGLPDLRGRVPIHQGTGAGLSAYTLGQSGGAASVSLLGAQLPIHNHPLNCQTGPGGSSSAANQYFAQWNESTYAAPGSTGNMASLVGTTGGSQAHDNMQPYLAINYIIATEGVYPSQN